MIRKPSIKTLRATFGDAAPEARRILEMSRAQLAETPAGAARMRECYTPPKTYDLRMHALNAAGAFQGVEALETESGEFADYLNSGDVYTPTVMYWRGSYRVQTVGDFLEIQERNGVKFK